MNELDLLKQVRSDVPDPDPLTLARARQRLLNASPVRRRAPRPRVLVAASLALALAGAFLAADVINHDNAPTPGTVADASTFLADAAGLSTANPDAPLRPGQYRQTTIQMERIHTFGTIPAHRATLHTRIDNWIPAGKSTTYVTRVDKNFKVDFPTPAARQAARKLVPHLFVDEKPKVRYLDRDCKNVTFMGRTVPGPFCKPSWQNPTPDFLARQPRDPDLLLTALRKHTNRGADKLEPDERAFRHLTEALSSGLVPADLRAALYQAARKIPGIKLLDNVTTLDGRRGRAVGYETNGYRSDLIISPSDGRMIGYRLVVTRDHPGKPNNDSAGNDYEVLLAGDIASETSILTRITTTPPPTK
ncbi:CU044_5270 family protein [Kribbella sp. NPDC023855]|uniref:CU044_5270 family protein n=1 Tax=Kribbella sp. NPDC023855 TaxID=3154698 RepID=UPI0033EFB4E8